ncbi:imidazolonepropionase [Motiliproteus sediminis]|uniref:imidazolonepropionase n=1 Tax=Motiliproteus sediminis TaxID=1468178 RepID=UPI001AEFA01E|nr:imidazolonepropionase [Motiliproteus sediminis]
MFKPTNNTQQLWLNACLVTLDGSANDDLAIREAHALAVADGRIQWLGPMTELDAGDYCGERFDLQGGWITPGLIDSHTHLVFGGQRVDEFSQRQQGTSYSDIAAAGGGIQASVRATRAWSRQQLVDGARSRLIALCREGVTTVEIKSGYGLTLDDELKMLAAARQLGEELPVRVCTTLLAAHAVPPEYRGNADGYVTEVCDRIIPAAADSGLADAVDLFCEGIGFSLAQSERVLQAARAHDLPVKIHAEQLSHLGGAALAAGYGALSADHLEYLDASGAAAMAAAGTVATLLPGAFYFLRESRLPPVQTLRDAGVPIALATDLNPGTSPLGSLRLMMNMGAVLFGLTPHECLAGVTRHAARALGLQDQRGRLKVGQQADLLVWTFDDPAELSYSLGWPQPLHRVLGGVLSHV